MKYRDKYVYFTIALQKSIKKSINMLMSPRIFFPYKFHWLSACNFKAIDL